MATTFNGAGGGVRRLRAVLGGSAGNLVEWYDWTAYLYFTLYFARHFFPEGDQTAQLLKAAAVSAVGFLARPLGAWLMGAYADRAGRRAAMTASVSLMCLGSLIIAIAPTYSAVGWIAPAILLGARILQGLSVGGEYGASATYLSEAASAEHRGFWSSFQYVTLIGGQLLAIGLLVILQNTMAKADLSEWGWRIPFFIGAALAVIVFWLRRGIDETFKATPDKGSGALHLFTHHPKAAFMVIGLTAGGSLTFYVWTSYMQKFLVNTTGFSKDLATGIMACALFAFMLLQPVFGALSDKIGRKPLLIFSYAAGAVATWPLMTTLAGVDTPLAAFALIMAGLSIQGTYSAISAVIKAELFPAHIRALGVALPYAIGNAIFGGSAESVALAFKQAGTESSFYIYVSAVLLVGLVVAILLPDTRKHSLIVDKEHE